MGSVTANIIIILILLAVIAGACAYIYREKKKGRHCIGCPYSAACPKRNITNSGCTGNDKEQ